MGLACFLFFIEKIFLYCEYKPGNCGDESRNSRHPKRDRNVGCPEYRQNTPRHYAGRKRGLVFAENGRNKRDNEYPLAYREYDILPYHLLIVPH